jgi:hypothetical protein
VQQLGKNNMTTEITWTVTQMDCYPEVDNETDVVFTVHWQCTGTDGTYNGRVYSTCGVTVNPDEPFTPYADLTQDQVLGWIWTSGVDKDATEAAVEQQIETQINPTVVSPALPW